jgi:hypothetical protein
MLMQQEIAYLRRSAQRLREIARPPTPISSQLIEMAEELEAKADKMARDSGTAIPSKH